MSQSKLSKLENCRLLPNIADIKTLCDVYGVRPADREELIQLVLGVREARQQSKVVVADGAAQQHQTFLRVETSAKLQRGFQPAMIVGALQTEAYARVVLGQVYAGPDLDRAVAKRMSRASALDDSSRQFVFIFTEGALRWHAGSAEIMVEQIEALVTASRRDNVRIGVIPWTTPVGVFCTHAFQVWDTVAVTVGNDVRTDPLIEPEDVETYGETFARLEAVASFDDGARRELARIASEYRLLI